MEHVLLLKLRTTLTNVVNPCTFLKAVGET